MSAWNGPAYCRGRFATQLGRYSVGDFDEADETVEHQPVVEDGTS